MAPQLSCLGAARLFIHLSPSIHRGDLTSIRTGQHKKAGISILRKRGCNGAAFLRDFRGQDTMHRYPLQCAHISKPPTNASVSTENNLLNSRQWSCQHSSKNILTLTAATVAAVGLLLVSPTTPPAWATAVAFEEAFPSVALEREVGRGEISGQAVMLPKKNLAALAELPPLPTAFPPLPEVSLPKYEKVLLPNGLRVFLVEDHEIGLVEGQLLVRGGGRTEPAEKVGLARLTAAVQRSGGSVSHPSDALDSLLERKAASIEVSSSASQMAAAFSSLAEDLPDILSLFSEVVRQPAMPEDKLSLARNQLLASIERRNDYPEGIAAREFGKLLYGRDSLYVRSAEVETVTAVTRSDLLSFHAANFRPEAAVLGLWGDFDSLAAKGLVESLFGDWEGSASVASAVSPTIERRIEEGFAASEAQIYLISKPGLTQGYVRMGELGTTLNDPDIYALDVLNGVLNGFGGRLFDQVRSRAGLAYSVSGAWSPAVEHRGTFVAGGATRVDAVAQFVSEVQRVLTEVTVSPPTADELARAKDAALNSFVFNFADSGSQLSRIMTYDLFGIPQDFVFDYQAQVQATTADDVLLAARRHLHPSQQCILIVSDADIIQSRLAALDTPLQILSLS